MILRPLDTARSLRSGGSRSPSLHSAPGSPVSLRSVRSLILLASLALACASRPAAAPHASDAELAAYERARPVFEEHCARCHTSGGTKASRDSLAHFSMDGYPFGGHHAAEIGHEVRAVLGVEGGSPVMPADDKGAVQGEALEAVVDWSRAFDAAHPR